MDVLCLGLIAFSSYNPLKNNCKRDCVLLSIANLATSLYTALVIFCVLGYMGHKNYMQCIDKCVLFLLKCLRKNRLWHRFTRCTDAVGPLSYASIPFESPPLSPSGKFWLPHAAKFPLTFPGCDFWLPIGYRVVTKKFKLCCLINEIMFAGIFFSLELTPMRGLSVVRTPQKVLCFVHVSCRQTEKDVHKWLLYEYAPYHSFFCIERAQ